MVMSYNDAIDYLKSRWPIGIRGARTLLSYARNGVPIVFGVEMMYYRSDRKYAVIHEGKL